MKKVHDMISVMDNVEIPSANIRPMVMMFTLLKKQQPLSLMSIRWHDNANLNALNVRNSLNATTMHDNATTMHDNAAELLEVKVLKHKLIMYASDYICFAHMMILTTKGWWSPGLASYTIPILYVFALAYKIHLHCNIWLIVLILTNNGSMLALIGVTSHTKLITVAVLYGDIHVYTNSNMYICN